MWIKNGNHKKSEYLSLLYREGCAKLKNNWRKIIKETIKICDNIK